MNFILNKIKGVFSISFLDLVYKTIIFGDFFIVIFPFAMKRYISKTRKHQLKTLENLKNKKQVIVAFFLQTPSTWKYDALYKKLAKSERFKPIVIITPYNVHINYSKSERLNVIKQSEIFAKEQNYNVVTSYNFENKKWLNIRKLINPDIIFFTKPYKDTLPAYYIYEFRDKITCYVPYGVWLLKDRVIDNYNLPLQNLLYHFFLETEINLPYAKKYSIRKGDNISLVGNLGMERLMDKKYIPKDVWKSQSKNKKRIIWAPHHTVNYMFNTSNFLSYYDFMLEMAKKYEDKIQFAFKPHPVLKFRLLNLWGQEKTEKYYSQWKNFPNTQLEEGYYDDLFLMSDAMIHDSITFTVEYIYTNKPSCFTVRNKNIETTYWNEFAQMAFNLHYHAYNEKDIESFIENIVLNGKDIIYDERKVFYDNYLYPKDEIMPSNKIMQILESDVS